MATFAEPTVSGSSRPLADALNGLRRRWRWRHAAVGLAVTLGVALIAFWIAAAALQATRYPAPGITAARWGLGILVAAVAGRWMVYPLVRRVPDARLALYLEERVPELGGAVLSAVEVAQVQLPDDGRSALLTHGLFRDAARRLARTPAVGRLEDGVTRGALALSALIAASFAALVLLGPSWVGQSARLLLVPWRDAGAAPVYAIEVTPGDATVARGSDVEIGARLLGFASDVVELSVRRGASGEWEHVPMGPARDSTRFTARLFDVEEGAEYFVESNGVRSPPFKLAVKELPAVRRVDLELQFPPYTGLAAERLDDVGDIAAVKGTRVTIRVRATRAVAGGRLVLDGDSAAALLPVDDSTLSATIVVRRDGFYRVELQSADGTRVAGNVDYVIDAMDDLPPQVMVRRPGRDVRPTSVEEVFVEAEATDDYGVGRVELHYQVNGGETQTVVLSDGRGRRPRELSAGHTLFLEELGLQPGDVVSYFVTAWDNDAVSGAKRATTDIYFLTIRPFDREYRQNQRGGGGGGGQGGDNPGTLVARQREIISATFKTERDRPATETAAFRNDVTTIHLAQGQLREQVQQTLARMQRPAVQAADTTFRVMAGLMPKVVAEMGAAEELLAARSLKEALAPEQRALQLLERVDALFREVQVSMQSGGGGGGGGANADAEDLADLFELETDKLRNQYEQVQSGAQQQASREVDETLERLKRLAARQQQENERARQRAQTGATGGSGGGGQRQMAEEAEQLARRLERLAREQQSPELQETARALQDAANAMRRSAAGNGQQGRGNGTAAQDRLESARRLLEESRGRQTARGVEGAAERARELARQQREVQQEVARLGDGESRAERERRLDDRKEQMAQGVEALEQQLDQLARDALRDRAETARKLKDAANAIREGRIDDKIRFSRDVMRGASREYANNLEGQIADDLDRLRERVAGASAAAVSDSAQRTARSLAQARDLVRSLASIDERMRERMERGGVEGRDGVGGRQGDQGEREAPGQSRALGREGEQGQSGRQGQAGQAGQAGQSGQAGQLGEGSRQGQSGQRGASGQGGAGGERGSAGGPMPNGGRLGGEGQGAPGGGRLSSDDVRQFSRELRAQREGAEGLRRDLARDGRSTADLDRLIARLRQLESGRVFNDPEELAQLRVAVLEGFKEFEFSLRRQLGEREREGPVLGGGDDVPPGYRDLVSEYFRALSRKGKP